MWWPRRCGVLLLSILPMTRAATEPPVPEAPPPPLAASCSGSDGG